jgi:hypothetical protein
MNRRKKIKQLLKAHAKKASAKLAPPNRSQYISKADRLKLTVESSQAPIITPEIDPPIMSSKVTLYNRHQQIHGHG